MDKSLFISMNGAKNAMHQLEIVTNNLANVNTTAFRGDSTYMSQFSANHKGNQTRTYSKLQGTFTNFDKGNTLNTERDLDVAVNGDGLIAVQSKSGGEGYTRNGNFMLQTDGTLTTQSGQVVMGVGGVINIPPAEKIHISPDGTISARVQGSTEFVAIDRIKLVNPDTSHLNKGPDGLFYLAGGSEAAQDMNVHLITGALEGSNVNAIDTMTKLIDLSRSYEIHTNYMKTIADNTAKSNELLALS